MKQKTLATPLIIILILLVLAIAAGGLYYLRSEPSVAIHAVGEKEVTTEVGKPYHDKGATAVVTRLLKEPKTLDVITNGSVDTTKLGEYQLTYVAMYDGTQYTDTRTVRVVDTESPKIEIREEEIENTWYNNEKQITATALDNYDGDITDRIKTVKNGDSITYTVRDSSGNSASTNCSIAMQEIAAPEIVFPNESDVVYSYTNEELMMPDPVAIDGNGNDLSDKIVKDKDVDTRIPGRYEVKYTLTNTAGESVEAYRTIIVEAKENTLDEYDRRRVIHLTFEGGPCGNTPEILNILSKYKIKATFFVSGQNSNYYYLLSDIHKAGHSIGAGSYSTDYKDVYETIDNYERDLERIQRTIRKYTGRSTSLIRFPGGSFTGSNADEILMNELRISLNNLGYKFSDWTIDSNDLMARSPERVYNSVINQIKEGRANVVMMHDASPDSVEALEDIINWGIDNGYTFLRL